MFPHLGPRGTQGELLLLHRPEGAGSPHALRAGFKGVASDPRNAAAAPTTQGELLLLHGPEGAGTASGVALATP